MPGHALFLSHELWRREHLQRTDGGSGAGRDPAPWLSAPWRPAEPQAWRCSVTAMVFLANKCDTPKGAPRPHLVGIEDAGRVEHPLDRAHELHRQRRLGVADAPRLGTARAVASAAPCGLRRAAGMRGAKPWAAGCARKAPCVRTRPAHLHEPQPVLRAHAAALSRHPLVHIRLNLALRQRAQASGR